MDKQEAGKSATDPKNVIVRKLIFLFCLLFVAIIFNAVYSFINEKKHVEQTISKELGSRLEIANSLKNNEIEKLRIISDVVQERNQVFSDYLDYDKIEPITTMLRTISSKYKVNFVLLFNEDGNFVTANSGGENVWEYSLYNMLISDRQIRTGIEIFPKEIPINQFPELEPVSGNGKLLCIKSVIHIIHPTGEIYGYIVLLRFINNNSDLVKEMAKISKAEITFYDQNNNTILTSFNEQLLPYPDDGVLKNKGVSYVVSSADIKDFRDQTIGKLAVAINREDFAKHWMQQVISLLIPVLISVIISLILFVFLKFQVFNRIKQLMTALHKVSGGKGDLSIRLEIPHEKMGKNSLNEMDSLSLDFNYTMDKLEKTYSELMIAQKEIEDANLELESRVRERTLQFEKANEDLIAEINAHKQAEKARQRLEKQLLQAKKMEAIGTLAGGVAHDLNNVLSGIINYPELLMMKIPPDSPLKDDIMSIKKSGEKAAAIVQDLLTLARRMVSVTEVLNINDIISEYIASPEYERLALYHPKVQLETALGKNMPNILGSPLHLFKTVMNLVSNAAEAIPEEGKILISSESIFIEKPLEIFSDMTKGEYILLTVSDTGVGISPEDIEKIFEPFYTKKKMGRSGTGLGMAVVWGSVKDHGGHIDVQSTVGKGTTIKIYFPATKQTLKKNKPLASIEKYQGKGEQILVVDDIYDQRDIAEKILKELGYSVVSVSSGEEAVDYIKDNSADLILLDMIMDPGIDGLETCRRIIEIRPDQRIIIVSGFAESKRVKEANNFGVKTFIKKPYTLETIGLAIRNELDKNKDSIQAS